MPALIWENIYLKTCGFFDEFQFPFKDNVHSFTSLPSVTLESSLPGIICICQPSNHGPHTTDSCRHPSLIHQTLLHAVFLHHNQ